MKKRDSNGRFIKEIKEGYTHLAVDLPSFIIIIVWILILFIIFPWILIITKFNIFQKMDNIFDSLLKKNQKQFLKNGKKVVILLL